MMPMHATATSNPQQLRWVVSSGSLPADGTVQQAPGRLGVLLDDGVIDTLVVRDDDVLITVSAGTTWRELGDEIRNALSDALADPAGWRVDSATDKDAQLAKIASELLAGQIDALAQSHGGSIEVVSVRGRNVTVRSPAPATAAQRRAQHCMKSSSTNCADGCPIRSPSPVRTIPQCFRQKAAVLLMP